jgi:hypothetical protein
MLGINVSEYILNLKFGVEISSEILLPALCHVTELLCLNFEDLKEQAE